MQYNFEHVLGDISYSEICVQILIFAYMPPMPVP